MSMIKNYNENGENKHVYDPKILEEVMKQMNMNDGIIATADGRDSGGGGHHQHHHTENDITMMSMDDDMHMNMDDDTSNSDKSDNVFCTRSMMMMSMPMASHKMHGSMHGSSGTIMYMDGFHMTLNGGHECLNLYFPTWTLDTRPKFIGACLGIILLSFLTEGLSKLRYKITASSKFARRNNRRDNQRQNNTTGDTDSHITTTPEESIISVWMDKCAHIFNGLNKRLVHLMISVLHGVQALLGYILMLAGMTFSVELLLSVILGLGIGYAVFFSNDSDFENHVTTNPCCNYMQDEANEMPNKKNNSNDDNTSMGSEEDDMQIMINNMEQQQQSADVGTLENPGNVI